MKKNGMIEDPQQDAESQKAGHQVGVFALLIACAIVGLWLFAFSSGYDVGRDIALGVFKNKG